MGARSGNGGLNWGFRYHLKTRVGSKGTFITGNPLGETNDYNNYELTIMGDKGTITTKFSNAKQANKVVKGLQKIGFTSQKGFPVYKYGDRNEYNKYKASKGKG